MFLAFARQARSVWHRELRSTHRTDCIHVGVRINAIRATQADCSFSTVAAALQDLVQTGRLRADQTQDFAAQVLGAVQTRVQQETKQQFDQAAESADTSKPDLNAQKATPNSDHPKQQTWPMPRGAYLWGTIGSGKTMLLDLFCTTFSNDDRTDLGLCRLHFHEFMMSVHRRLHFLQQSVPRIQGKSQFGLPVYRCSPVLAVCCWVCTTLPYCFMSSTATSDRVRQRR